MIKTLAAGMFLLLLGCLAGPPQVDPQQTHDSMYLESTSSAEIGTFTGEVAGVDTDTIENVTVPLVVDGREVTVSLTTMNIEQPKWRDLHRKLPSAGKGTLLTLEATTYSPMRLWWRDLQRRSET